MSGINALMKLLLYWHNIICSILKYFEVIGYYCKNVISLLTRTNVGRNIYQVLSMNKVLFYAFTFLCNPIEPLTLERFEVSWITYWIVKRNERKVREKGMFFLKTWLEKRVCFPENLVREKGLSFDQMYTHGTITLYRSGPPGD